MREFDHQLDRLKAMLRMSEDQDVAEALGMSKAAFSARKTRGAFPVDKLKALAADQPKLHIDVKYVLTGISDELERRLSAVGTASKVASKVKDSAARYKIQQEVFDAIVGALSADEQKLVHCYRNADERGKALLLATAVTVGEPSPSKLRRKDAK